MDWRPFVASFVDNTYEDFCKKVDSSLELFKPKRSSRSPMFLYQPSDQEVEDEQQKFQDLRKHVMRQRKQIRLKDALLHRAEQHRKQEYSKKLLEAKSTRKAFMQQVRSFASAHPRPITTILHPDFRKPIRLQHTEREEESSFFALTAAEDAVRTEKRVMQSSLLPPVRGARSEDNAGDLSFFSRRAK